MAVRELSAAEAEMLTAEYGGLQRARFAESVGTEAGAGMAGLRVATGPRAVPMCHSDATAEPLLSTGTFGADVIRFAAGGSVPPHTHAGDHLLFVLAGCGEVWHVDRPYPLTPGLAYLVRGEELHSIVAETDLVLLAVGNAHRPADSPQRLELALTDAGD